MNCRIEPGRQRKRVCSVVRYGGLSGRHVRTLKGLLGRDRSAVVIDLKDLLLVDREAVKILAFSETDSAALTLPSLHM
jgi:hypothetical protein